MKPNQKDKAMLGKGLQTLFSGLLALTFVAFATNIDAQEPMPAEPPAEAQIEIEDEELRTFTEIYIEVEETLGEHERAVVELDDPEQAAQMEQETEAEVSATVEEHGMDPVRYSEIVEALNADPLLAMEFQEMYDELHGERHGDDPDADHDEHDEDQDRDRDRYDP